MFQVAGRACGRSQGRGSRAFTLIEVLVVVAIIALLISILLPSLAKARFQAKSVACKGNLHDLGTAFTVYTETYKGYYPITPSAGFDSYWSLYKANLLKNRKVLLCPATNNAIKEQTLMLAPDTDKSEETGIAIEVGDNTDLGKVAPGGPRDSSGGHSYEYNGVFDDNKSGGRKFSTAKRHKRTTFFRLPFHSLALVHDADEALYGNVGCVGSIFSSGNNCPQPKDSHGAEGMNIMFGDGHGDWVKKLSGRFEDYRYNPPKVTEKNPNASIDRLWVQSQHPIQYVEK